MDRLHTSDMGQAEAAVQQDIRTGDEFGIQETPTFLLCLADGTVLKLQSLEQVSAQLQ